MEPDTSESIGTPLAIAPDAPDGGPQAAPRLRLPRRVVGRLVTRSWPTRLAISVAALAVALFALWVVVDNAECGTDCAPLSAEYLLQAVLFAAAIFGLVFVVVLVLALLARAVARRVGWHPRRRREGVVLALVAVFVLGVGVERAGMLGRPAAADDFELIEEAWGLLHEHYVLADDLDSTYMAHAAIWAMTEAVGDAGHTVFLPPEEAEKARDPRPAARTIGATLELLGDVAVVRTVTSGGPADRAGLRVGDRVLAFDGRSPRGLADAELAGELREDAGDFVTVTVNRVGTTGSLTLEIECDEAARTLVEWSMVPGRPVALIWIPEFEEGVADDLADILDEVAAAEATGVILDLRGNPGGWSDEGVGVVSHFLASGLVNKERDADGVIYDVPVSGDPIDTTTPLVVLVDGDSASASEIVASALQVAGRARLVGVKTAGTGTSLAEFPLADGSALWIGMTEWLTADGRSVWHEGLEPDVDVAIPDGVEPLRPADLATLDWDGLRRSGDAQLLAALRVLDPTAFD